MNVLFTAIGRRVQLIKHFKQWHYIVGVDSGEMPPARYFVDSFYKVPKWDGNNYIEILINICKKEKIDLLIPLFEKEFVLLCENRKAFEKIGTFLLLSHKTIIEIFNDKIKSYEFFTKNRINTPLTFTKESIYAALKKDMVKFPLIIKPLNGMGSKNVFKVKNKKELDFFINYIENPIIQEFVEGTEYTIDVLCDFNGDVISVVPRKRIEVRAGEVSKSKTIKDKKIIELTLDLCNKVKINKDIKPIGPLTIQCITNLKETKFIEVNPRFGGGVPLTFEAGIPYGKYLEEMVKGNHILPVIGNFKELTMLRFDEAVYI